MKHIEGDIRRIERNNGKKKPHTIDGKELIAKLIAERIKQARIDGFGRGISIKKSGYSERTVYSYSQQFDFLRDELNQFKHDRRFYK